jgi:uncharacterized protein
MIAAAKQYHLEQTGGDVARGLTRFVWHGGEPLSLPISYWRDVIKVQRQILVHESAPSIPHRNDVQTNLFALSSAYLHLFEEEVAMVNVSFDGAPGTRVTKPGRHTEDRVIENMQRLRERNIRFGANVVVGGHTRHRLVETYKLLKTAGARQMTVIPLIPANHFSDDEPFAISSQEAVTALEELYLHWSSDPEPIPVIPLNHYLRTVRLHQLNLASVDSDRGAAGEHRLIVDTEGDLYVRVQRSGKERRLGNLFSQTLAEIFQSANYAASLESDNERCARVCDSCAFRQACDTRPALQSSGTDSEGRCPIAARLCDFIAACAPSDTLLHLVSGGEQPARIGL